MLFISPVLCKKRRSKAKISIHCPLPPGSAPLMDTKASFFVSSPPPLSYPPSSITDSRNTGRTGIRVILEPPEYE